MKGLDTRSGWLGVVMAGGDMWPRFAPF